MNSEQLVETARAIVGVGKGILAADESPNTIKKRFDNIGVESTEETRRDYRELLFRTEGVAKYISGVIMYDETIRQRAVDGTPLIEVIENQGMIPGVKVDMGGKPLAGSPSEQVTEGLDSLRNRLAEYVNLGARFTKWRGIISIGDDLPSRYCIEVNAHALARFAALSQEAGLVPIVEPEVLMDGKHSIERCCEVTELVLREVYAQLSRHRVILEGSLLKPNMVISGKDARSRAKSKEVAEMTLACFNRSVPSAVPGIVFLSGGQTDEEATGNLDAIVRSGADDGAPWELSFSFGRALQTEPLKVWKGNDANRHGTQSAFLRSAYVTSMARSGAYNIDLDKSPVLS